MQDDLYSKSSNRTVVAGRYTRYRDGRLVQTVSVQFYWESVGTINLRPLY